MTPRTIQVRGARANNLQGVDLDLPTGCLIAFVGRSGSGKSSLAIDVLLAEGNRRLLGALGAEGAGALPRPAVDHVGGLPPVVGFSAGPPGRRTLGGCADLLELSAVLFARAGRAACPRCGAALASSRRDEVENWMVSRGEGARLTLRAPLLRGRVGGIADILQELSRQGFARVRLDGEDHRIEDLGPVDARRPHDLDLVVDRVRVEAGREERLAEGVEAAWLAGKGRLIVEGGGATGDARATFAEEPWCEACDLSWPRPTVASFMGREPASLCPACLGEPIPCGACGGARGAPIVALTRLPVVPRSGEASAEAAHRGLSFGALLQVPLGSLATHLEVADLTSALPSSLLPPARALQERLGAFLDMGLGHLPLGRPLADCSDGERRRAELAGALSAELSGVLYILDEPCAGLGPEEAAAVARLLLRRTLAGNTVLVVDHHPMLIAAATSVVELGPGAGPLGGRVTFQGPPAGCSIAGAEGGLTGGAHPAPRTLPAALPTSSARPLVHLEGAVGHGGAPASFSLYAGQLLAITGVSGSGKSALVEGTLEPALRQRLGLRGPDPLPFSRLDSEVTRLVSLDRGGAVRSPRSCLATLTGLWTPLRELLAASREAAIQGFGPERFSFNRPGGRCEACEGQGARRLELGPLPPVSVPCELCAGRRFDRATLRCTWRGRSAADLLDARVEEAAQIFAQIPRLSRLLGALGDLGLGYLSLGQRGDSLSGGELGRVRLGAELGQLSADATGTLICLDGPELGLHPIDAQRLARHLRDLCDKGAAVLVTTRSPIFEAVADTQLRLSPPG